MQKLKIQSEIEHAFCMFPKHYDYMPNSDPIAFYFMNIESTTFYIRKSRTSFDLIVCNFSDMDYLEKKLKVKSKVSSGTKFILFQVFSSEQFHLIVKKFYYLSYTILNYYKSRFSIHIIDNKRDFQNELCFSDSSKK